MNVDLRTVLKLQDDDVRIAGLKDEIARLPRQIAEIEKQLEGHIRQLEKDKAALAANVRNRKQLDLDIQTHQQKISKLRDQMLQAKTNEQYRAFQNEITYAETEIRKCEDRILDLMGEAELLEVNVRKAEAALTEEKKQVEAEKARAKQRTDADRKELAEVSAQRAQEASSLPANVLALYERLRQKSKHGIAIAEVKNGICLACRMALRPQALLELKAADSIVQCENCRTIIYVEEPPLNVEEQMNV